MAIENNDLFVLQKAGGGELRKASVSALLNDVVAPAVPEKLSDLSDVNDDTPSDGQVLKWSGTEWGPDDGGDAVIAYPGYGIAVEAQGVRIGDDWSAIPTLP